MWCNQFVSVCIHMYVCYLLLFYFSSCVHLNLHNFLVFSSLSLLISNFKFNFFYSIECLRLKEKKLFIRSLIYIIPFICLFFFSYPTVTTPSSPHIHNTTYTHIHTYIRTSLVRINLIIYFLVFIFTNYHTSMKLNAKPIESLIIIYSFSKY